MSELQLKLLIRVALFVFLLPLASADCVELDLGMENGKIPDDVITASSRLSASTPAKNGRLNFTSGSSWCARTSDINSYLQIDLQTLHIICAVSTQGNSQEDHWVKSYTIEFSSDGSTWTGYKEGGKIKTFQGNSDRSSEVKHVLYESVRARYLQIVPNAYHGAKCVRMEVFGVKQKPVNVAFGKATFQSSTYNNTQLGVSGVSGKAVDGNSDTEFRNGSCTHTQKNNPSWWRIDLGSDKVAVSDIFIVNRFSASTDVMARSKNYSITLGDDAQIVNNQKCKGLYSFVNFTASAVCSINPLRTGRYVGISTVKEQSLQLCEVEIYVRDNLAFLKQTSQISEEHGGVSSRAVDGISNPDYYAKSCTHTRSEYNPWWRVDLGQVEPVSEIYLVNQENSPWFERQNNFEIRVGTVSDNNGGITNPRCGDKQSYKLPQGKGLSFYCRPVIYGRYVTIRSLKTHRDAFTLCEVEVYSERRACQMQAIGVASADTLPDASFSASSERSGFEASKGRLNANVGWLPSSNDQPDDYMQVDLQYEFLICAVATQGRLTYDDWTTGYKLQLSFDGSTFVTYKENNVDKIFSGNSGRHDIVKHSLKNVRARFIRFQPVKFARSKALRVEVYGVLISRVPSQAPSKLTLSARSSTSITASWQLPPTYSRHGIITGFKLFYKKKGFLGSMSAETINGGTTFSGDVTGLDKYTEYEFQVLAFTSHGDGPKSSVVVERTMEDVPSQPPSGLTVAASTLNSVLAFWQLPPEDFRHGIITGYKLFYKESGGDTSSTIELLISDAANRSISVTGLQTSTDYNFQVLAFTSVGDGPKSSVEVVRTFLGVPDHPRSFNHTLKTPTESQGPVITLSWTSPSLSNGVIRKYSVFYHHDEDPHTINHETVGPDVFSYTIEVLGGVTYWFEVRAEIIQPGDNASLTVDIPEYKPSGGPANLLSAEVNKTTLNISWAPLPREQSNGDVILYNVKEELLSRGIRQKRSPLSSKTVNTSNTFIILRGLLLCSQYQVSVRAYTKVGPGPYGPPVELPRTSGPESPTGLIATNVGASQVTLEWKEPELRTKDGLSYRVKYLGTKSYNESFREEGFQEVGRYTSYTLKGLAPGSIYDFQIIVSSVCGLGEPKGFPYTVKTKITAPVSPAVLSVANKRISTTTVAILLWPAEQRNGPISSYQVIVLNVVDGVEDLPPDYASKLKDPSDAEIGNLSFYVAAEIENTPGMSWEFNVGDGKTYGAYKNKELHIGEDYIVYQRAMTNDNGVILDGPVSKVAKISVTEGVGVGKKEGSQSVSIAQIVVPVALVIVLVPLLLFAILLYRRRRQAEKSSQGVNSNKVHVPLGELRMGLVESSGSTADLVYQNVSEIPSHENVGVKASLHEEKESVYSEADDGKPKPIPVAEFAQYFKNKSANGAVVLKEEFKKLPGISSHSWDIGKSNKMKNRFGNITTYDHSRVVLEKIEGDPKSDYINASYIPTFDEESMNYIATQGPTSTTISDFWRMIWQKNCSVIVMLTNLVELGKNKCNQYWPDSATRFGSITVTLLNTQNFADYCIRTLKLVKGRKTREVHQYHFTSWPDRGVPHHSTALLGFRWKVHARNQTTSGPLVVHCSAGVGRTGTYIAIDAMLEGAKKKNTVFIQNYVKVMREHRPYMVQKDTQYVFIHQAVMEALTCGTTEVASQDLRIRMNKLARVMSDAKHTGYAEEFKRLELVSGCQSSGEEFTEGFKPSNFNKNRFSNILPMDSARVLLRSSEPNEDYINASFVDDYSRRNAYILTQAPLNNTINDFWRMISQYDIGTIVTLHSLKEEKESYPQYWPSEGSAKYGDITLQLLSEKTAKNITTSKLSVTNAMPPKKTSTVQHLQFTGWANRESNPDPREILDLLTVIEQSQQQSGDGVIVFQCSDGVGRSGCVATIMSVIERVKIEQTVDVFQTIKLIRAKRPGAVNTLDLYSFCYKTILAYLDSFNCYSNFADC